MGQLAVLLKTLAVVLPLLKQLIDAAEPLFPGSGNGAKKLEVVRVGLQSAINVVGDATVSFDAIWPMISPVIGAIVAVSKK